MNIKIKLLIFLCVPLMAQETVKESTAAASYWKIIAQYASLGSRLNASYTSEQKALQEYIEKLRPEIEKARKSLCPEGKTLDVKTLDEKDEIVCN